VAAKGLQIRCSFAAAPESRAFHPHTDYFANAAWMLRLRAFFVRAAALFGKLHATDWTKHGLSGRRRWPVYETGTGTRAQPRSALKRRRPPMYTHNRPHTVPAGAVRFDLTQEAYVRHVAEKARARLDAADHAMRRLEAKAPVPPPI
jgi:hypothetical protein